MIGKKEHRTHKDNSSEHDKSEMNQKTVHEKAVHVVDTKLYIDSLMDLVREGNTVNLMIAGGSMCPFLVNQRDSVKLEPMKRKPKEGDIVLFQRENGAYVLHRIYRVKEGAYYIIGDAQVELEGPVYPSQICCIIEQARRKGKWIDCHDFWWRFFEKVWLKMIPLRRPVIALYGIIKKAGT